MSAVPVIVVAGSPTHLRDVSRILRDADYFSGEDYVATMDMRIACRYIKSDAHQVLVVCCYDSLRRESRRLAEEAFRLNSNITTAVFSYTRVSDGLFERWIRAGGGGERHHQGLIALVREFTGH